MENSMNRKIAQEKLMILYIIKKSNCTITYNQLSNLILEYDLLNYFTFVEYFNELKNSNFIDKSPTPELILTEFSLQILELLDDNIDKSAKELIDNIFSTDIIVDNISEFQLVPLKDGKYIVNLYLKNDLDPNFSFSFTVASLEKAKEIEQSWVNKNKSLYVELLRIINDSI